MSFLGWIFVPKCAHCKKRLAHDTRSPLCPECLAKWEKEKSAVCPNCGRPPEKCWCGVEADTEKNIYFERHLSYYSPQFESVTKPLIFSIKENLNVNTVDMLSREMAEMVSSITFEGDCVLTHVPRSPKSVRYYGFDQTLELVKRIADLTSLSRIVAIEHRGATVQKNLNYKQRQQNVKDSYFLAPDAKDKVSKRCVVLLDDIVTTGATAAYCAKLLKKAGASRVYFISIAKSYR